MGIDVGLIRGDFQVDVFNCAVCLELLEDPVTIKGMACLIWMSVCTNVKNKI